MFLERGVSVVSIEVETPGICPVMPPVDSIWVDEGY
jgi:hypothetical protein